MKCLLISTLLGDVRCIGLLHIYQFIKASKRHDVKLVFLPNHIHYDATESEDLIQFIREEGFQVIGFSLMTQNYHKCVEMTRQIHEQLPGIKVVWGGIHPSIAPDECESHPDYLCVGEGEVPMLELLDRLQSGEDTTTLENFRVKQNGAIIRNGTRYFSDIAEYPFITYDWDNFYMFDDGQTKPFDRVLYRKYMNWNGTNYSTIATRGCPYSCTYCCNSILKERMYGSALRRRHVKDIIEELKHAKADLPFTKVVNFQDDCFLASTEAWLEEFCQAYKQEIGLPFFLRTTPTYMQDDKLRWLKDAGLIGVSMGLQTGDDQINKEVYNRKVLAKDFLQATQTIKKHKLWAVYDIILQGPYDTDESNLKTAEVLLQTPRPFSLNTFNMVLFPQTILWRRCREEGITVDGDPYARGYGTPRDDFWREFFALIPVMPSFAMRRLLKKRETRWASRTTNVLFNRLKFFRNMRNYLDRRGFNPRVVQMLFRIQSALFRGSRS